MGKVKGKLRMKIHSMTLNWNGNGLLKTLLPTLLTNLEKTSLDADIYVRDNGSIDGSIETLKQFPVNILSIDHNRDSFAVGMNYIFEQISEAAADDDVLLFLNNDIIFKDNNSLLNMIKIMERVDAAVVGTKLLYENGTISHNGVIFSSKYNNMPWHFRKDCVPTKDDELTRKFQAVTAACCLVKVKHFKKAGMFDTNLFWAFEDVALNLDISINQKQPIVCCGKTNIIHNTSVSLQKNPVHKMFMQRNVSYFKNNWEGKYKIDHDCYLRDPNYNLIK